MPKLSLSLRDSIIREYFSSIDANEFYDTTNDDYRILRAYIKNDTPFFKRMTEDIKADKKAKRYYSPIDSCLQLKKISEINADEVYRFSHDESFCFYSQRVTISKSGSSILLHYLEFSATPDGNVIEYWDKTGPKKIGPGCKIEKEFFKTLTIKDWDLFERYVAIADYWLLKERQYHGCCDGSFWTIDGYTKRPMYYTGQQIHSVYRWTPNNSFAELGKMFIKLAGEKTMCRGFF